MIKCSKCLENINDKADACPKCGNPMKQKGNNPPVEGSKSLMLKVYAIGFFMILVGTILFLIQQDKEATERAERVKIKALEKQKTFDDYGKRLISDPRKIINVVESMPPTELEQRVRDEKYYTVNKNSSLSPDTVKKINTLYTAAGKARWAILEPKILAERKRKALEEAKRLVKEAKEKIRAQTTPIDFVTKSKAMCQKYEEAKNEIQKSNVFNNHKSMLRSSAVQNKRGRIDNIKTDQGGSEASIHIDFGANVNFVNFDVKNGARVYNQASNFASGECVIFSGHRIRANSLFERSQVCDFDYYITLTNLLPCPK